MEKDGDILSRYKAVTNKLKKWVTFSAMKSEGCYSSSIVAPLLGCTKGASPFVRIRIRIRRASGKSFECAHDWHVTAYANAYVIGFIYECRRLRISLLISLHHFMAPVHSKPLLDVCLREELL